MSDKFICKISFVGLLVLFAPVTFGKTCWNSTWYNSFSPADHGGSDNESQPIDVINTLCQDGSPAIDAQCKDEKGEPFRGFKNDTSSRYVANCTVETGLICYPYSDGECADFAIQYGCACLTTLPPQKTPPGGLGTSEPSSNTIVNGYAGSTSGPGGSTSGIRSGSTGIGSSPSGIGSGSVSSGPGGSSIGNTNGEGLTGSGSSGQSVGNGSSGSPGGRNSSENGSNGSSAFGSCPCRNGSYKIDGSFYAVLLNVLLMLRLF